MKTLTTLLALLVIFAIAGCDDDSSNNTNNVNNVNNVNNTNNVNNINNTNNTNNVTVTPESFAQELAAEYCAIVFACCDGSAYIRGNSLVNSEAECNMTFGGFLLNFLTRPGIEVQSEYYQDCADDFLAPYDVACDEPIVEEYEEDGPAGCMNLVEGTLVADEACDDDDQCLGDLACIDEVCTVLPGLDESCADSWECEAPYVCRYNGTNDDICVEAMIAGDNCTNNDFCDDGLYCDGTCQVQKAAGEACVEYYECESYDCTNDVCVGDDDTYSLNDTCYAE
ncbi:hypothetical protein KJ865_14080 [Myxococcota bacterium]|nr:hypothetical protein [Myxococcota bacterium]